MKRPAELLGSSRSDPWNYARSMSGRLKSRGFIVSNRTIGDGNSREVVRVVSAVYPSTGEEITVVVTWPLDGSCGSVCRFTGIGGTDAWCLVLEVHPGSMFSFPGERSPNNGGPDDATNG